MKKLTFWQVDAFTNTPFKGNPAAVFITNEPLDDTLMHNIAIEMNLSETAFLLLRPNQNPYLRWFTPMYEIDLCGHATLSTAQIYFSEIDQTSNTVIFDTKFSGPLTVTKNSHALSMDFPARPGKPVELSSIPPFVIKSLSEKQPTHALKSRDLMLVYDNETIIREMTPNYTALLDYKDFIIVTAQSKDPKYDFISRFYCASDGILEDPVTGSAHCTLAPYWSKVLNKPHLSAFQASKRGGSLDLKIKKDRVQMSGQAVTMLKGELYAPH